MAKFALYVKVTKDKRSYVTSIPNGSIRTLAEAKAYFMGMKCMSETQFDQQFIVSEMQESKSDPKKGLMFGNQ